MKTVRADHDVDVANITAGQGDPDPILGLVDRRHRLAVERLDVRAGRLEDPAEGAAHDLQVVATPVAEVVAGHPADLVAVTVDEDGALHVAPAASTAS